MTPIHSSISGVSKAVRMPFIVRPRLAKAPYLGLRLMAVAVPTAWEAVPSQHLGTGGRPEEPHANHNRCGQCRDAAQGLGYFYRDRSRDRFGCQGYDDLLRSSRPFGNQGNRYDTDRAAGHLAHDDGYDLLPDRFQLQVEWYAQGHYSGFEPEIDYLSGLLVCLVGDAGQFQENDEQHDADQDGIEQQPSGLFLQDFGQQENHKSQRQQKEFIF